jgi:hypothetical protein
MTRAADGGRPSLPGESIDTVGNYELDRVESDNTDRWAP